MALTQFEKDYIADMVDRMPRRGSADLETATQGTEPERQAMIAAHIANGALDMVAADIAGCDEQTAAIAERKAALEAKLASMQAYV